MLSKELSPETSKCPNTTRVILQQKQFPLIDNTLAVCAMGNFLKITEITDNKTESPKNLAEAYLKAGLHSFWIGNEQEGREFLTKASDIYSKMNQDEVKQLKSTFVSKLMADMFCKIWDKWDKKITDCTNVLINKEPDNYARVLNNRGVAYAEKASYSKTVMKWIRHLGMEENNGTCFQHYEADYDRAITDYTEVIALESQKPEFLAYIYRNRGKLYFDFGKYEKAIADYTEAIYLCPEDGEYLYHRGIAHDAKGDCKNAIADYTEAISLGSPPILLPEFFYNRGVVYDKMGEYGKAISDYSAVIQLGDEWRPCRIMALHNRCLAYKITGQLDKAETDFLKLRSYNENYGEVVCRRPGRRGGGPNSFK